MYLLKSDDAGNAFLPAQKIGAGTWKLNACPMDGGGLTIDASNIVGTTWQRNGTVYFCQPGQTEVSIGKGRNCAIAGSGANTVLTFQDGDAVKLIRLEGKKEIAVGNGGFLKSIVLPDNKILCVWEQDGKIRFRKV